MQITSAHCGFLSRVEMLFNNLPIFHDFMSQEAIYTEDNIPCLDWKEQTSKIAKLTLLIEIDQDLLSLNSNFNLAKTLSHKFIHAYLTLKKHDGTTCSSFVA